MKFQSTEDKFYTSDSTHRPSMLDMRSKTGARRALSYAYLFSVHLDETGSIEARFSCGTVQIEGQNLGDLYDHLSAQTATVIREAHPDRERPNLGQPYVSRITVQLAE